MSRPAQVPVGAWPAQMPAELAAGYCGEVSVDAFLRRVGQGKEYPPADRGTGRRRRWLKASLDAALRVESETVADAALEL